MSSQGRELTLQDILHRDLKSANLLCDSLEHPTVVKICDFGLSIPSNSSLGSTLAACGTPAYCAPEVLREDQFGKVRRVRVGDRIWGQGRG